MQYFYLKNNDCKMIKTLVLLNNKNLLAATLAINRLHLCPSYPSNKQLSV